MAALNRRHILGALGILILLCAGLPAAGFAGYNVLYFARERFAATPTSTPLVITPTASATATAAPVCGGPPAVFILLIGSDSRADNYSAGLADSIRIVRVDFVEPSLTFIAFPRDLYVEIPGIASHGGITHGKINQAYLYGNPGFGYFEGPGQGPGLLALTMRQNFGARIDHYVAINLRSFVRIVDQLGGLDINLPYTVDGRATRSRDRDRYFPEGPLHLDGYRAMLLARLRPSGDLERNNTQNVILRALAAKILTPASLPQLPGLVENLYRSVQTDLEADDISRLLCLGAMVNSDSVVAVDFPPELFTGTRVQDPVLGRTFVWEADFGILREYVQYFNAGNWPTSTLSSGPTPDATP